MDFGVWKRAALLSFACFQNITVGGIIYGNSNCPYSLKFYFNYMHRMVVYQRIAPCFK